MSEYVRIFIEGEDKPVITLASLQKMEERLPAYFMQVHRSYIVNLRKITEVFPVSALSLIRRRIFLSGIIIRRSLRNISVKLSLFLSAAVFDKSLQAEDDDKTKAPGAEIASGAFVLYIRVISLFDTQFLCYFFGKCILVYQDIHSLVSDECFGSIPDSVIFT